MRLMPMGGEVMDRTIADTLGTLKVVDSTEALEAWVKRELRPVLQHAALLCTLGNLYGLGSVPTHRISVDFPLDMVESLKNNVGALDDPLVFGWFRTQRPKHVDVQKIDDSGAQRTWRRTLLRYGMKSMMIHGVMDHDARRFAIFQVCNPYGDGSIEVLQLFASLVPEMARMAWRAVERRTDDRHRALIGHPTLALTSTEVQIVEMLAQGMSNKEIARRRGVSDSTVKTQVQRTGAKIGATRRAEIVALAMPMLRPLPPQSMVDYDDYL
jgi:DNA-binding CsgD family transcriptional regulator